MKRSKAAVTGEKKKKIHPKLRMVLNGDTTVNTIRAEHASALGVRSKKMLRSPLLRGNRSIPFSRPKKKQFTPASLIGISDEIEANIFIELNKETDGKRVRGKRSQLGNLISAQVKLSDIQDIIDDENVAFISLGDAINLPRPVVNRDNTSDIGEADRLVPNHQKHPRQYPLKS